VDEDGDTDCLKDDMPSLPLRHVRRQKSMVPGLDELGIWKLVGDWWSDAARPAPEADVRSPSRSMASMRTTRRRGSGADGG